MTPYKSFFKGKNITVMGLGILGRGLGYTKFLAEAGANLTVTDLKIEAELATSLKELKKFKNIKFVLGRHEMEDFRDKDMIIKAAGVPMNSPYIEEAKNYNIPVEMDVSLFSKLAPEVIIVGITGTRGKSMTTALTYQILKKNEKFLKRKIYLGGNVRGVATLPLLKTIKKGDIVVAELDSWQLQGFGDSRMSPHVSIFTSFMPDHMNYYSGDMDKYFADKANIFAYQEKGDLLVVRPEMKKLIPKTKSKLVVANAKSVANYEFIVPGEYQRENLACAVEVGKYFKIPEANMKKAITTFKGLEGRLQYLKSIKGVKIYNDNNATTPEATVAGIEALGGKKNIVLICGGSDKNLDLSNLNNAINKYCKEVIVLPGTGSEKLSKEFKRAKDLKDAVKQAISASSKGDIILFSPAFASFGMFKNEYDRNDQFVKIIKGLK